MQSQRRRPPGNKGRTYPPDPPTVEEIVALLKGCPDTPNGHRLRALIVVLWRSGLRISEALRAQRERPEPGARVDHGPHGKGGKRRVVGMDPWGWPLLEPWLVERQEYPPAAVFCVLEGPTAGRSMGAAQVRYELRRLAASVRDQATDRAAPVPARDGRRLGPRAAADPSASAAARAHEPGDHDDVPDGRLRG